KDLLAPVLKNTVTSNYYAASVVSNYTQYFGGYGYAAQGQSSCASTWSVMYTDVFPNLKLIKEKAAESGATHYKAVADIITAINLSTAVELWGDVVYSEATQPETYQYPSLDDGETVYSQALQLLDDAISALQGSDSSGIIMEDEDMIYGGDLDKWLRAAYTYKARLQLKLMKNGGTSASDVLTSINNGFTSNDDDFQLSYVGAPSNNPYYTINVTQRSTSNYYNALNDQLISLMNGNQYPFTSITEDPRLSAMFVKEIGVGVSAPATDPWRGFMNGGAGESSDGESGNTFYKDGGFHTSSDSPLILITYAEAMFIKAEAEFLNAGGTTTSTGINSAGYSAYLAGIQANMDKLSVSGSSYLADASVDVGEANLQLHNIMREKYIANIHNTETYNDFRRYDFSSDVFKGLDIRIQQPDDEYLGQWYRRAYYPETGETNSNPNIISDESTSVTDIWLFQ
ncbi:MAG: SusD/RagB family nutrient-binding outer membrane lipoprotein, partial [Flavobacteriaceae bacterium]|nr:SusD/RagB family nutrient-binding outer membrane lipoprotein [Flavobacteriaceae bacterium]